MPIASYEDFSPYVERVKKGETEAMFHREKVLMFAMTSGTTASRKYIPVTRRFLDDYRRGWMVWGIQMFEHHPELWFKTMVQIGSDWDETRSEANIPCGSISGLTTHMQRRVVRGSYCLPPSSVKLKDIQSKYYLTWRLGLVRDVGVIVSANPSTLVNLARFGSEHADRLIKDVHDGTINSAFPMSDAIKRESKARLAPNKKRAAELESIFSRTNRLLPRDVWPNLGVLANWTGGSVGAYMRSYGEWYGSPPVRDIGLVASEGRMTIPIEDDTSSGVLEISSTYFEFVPVDEIDSPQPTVLESDELEEGREYYILLTTSAGFYRYNIFDVVRCTGFYRKTPLLEFLNKGAYFSNMTGEKISEHQVVQAVGKAAREVGVNPTAFSLAPIWDDRIPYYGLFVERSDVADDALAARFAAATESALRSENSEYESKRDTFRLGPIRVFLTQPGFWKEWDRERLKRNGGVPEQYKHPCLISDVAFAESVADKRPVDPN
jgi:hypothetical protein